MIVASGCTACRSKDDGSIDVDLHSRGSLDADLYIYENRNARKPLARSLRSGHRDRVRGSICGLRHILIAVVRYKGRGSYTLRATLPYSNNAYATATRAGSAHAPPSQRSGPRLHIRRVPGSSYTTRLQPLTAR